MIDPEPPRSVNPEPAELMRALGRLVRGLSALFWGLPLSFLACFYTARADVLRQMGVLPPLIGSGLLVYGLWQLSAFQRQERIWRVALDRAMVLGLILVGLSPFLYWSNQMPESQFFLSMTALMALSGLLLLGALNIVLKRLGAMLPDQAFRLETRQYSSVNLKVLALGMTVAASYFLVEHYHLEKVLKIAEWLLDRESVAFLVPLCLLPPVAMTMALIWKAKEVVLDGVFGAK